MELLKPLTEGLNGQSDDGTSGVSSGRDLYSWFWAEGLAGQLAGAWPMPPLPGIEGAGDARSVAPRVENALSRRNAEAPAGPASSALLDSLRSAAAAGLEQASAPAASTRVGIDAAAGGIEGPALPSGARGTGTASSGEAGALDALVERASRLFELPVNLVRAVVQVESGGRTDAVSKRGAVGPMQVMPGTAREMGARDPHNPWQNLYAGAKYLSRQIDRFGSVSQALAAYNAGPGAVEEHGGIPPYPETRAYVRKVLQQKAQLDREHPEGA